MNTKQLPLVQGNYLKGITGSGKFEIINYIIIGIVSASKLDNYSGISKFVYLSGYKNRPQIDDLKGIFNLYNSIEKLTFIRPKIVDNNLIITNLINKNSIFIPLNIADKNKIYSLKEIKNSLKDINFKKMVKKLNINTDYVYIDNLLINVSPTEFHFSHYILKEICNKILKLKRFADINNKNFSTFLIYHSEEQNWLNIDKNNRKKINKKINKLYKNGIKPLFISQETY